MADSDFLRDPATGKPLQINAPAVEEGQVDPRALARLFQGRKIAEAEKAMAAAIQFQGLRGYQNALQSGKPAAEALTRYGPMMFYTRPQAFGPAVRAITPPTITPYQQATIDERARRAKQPIVTHTGRGEFVSRDPATGEIKTVREATAKGRERTFNAVVEPGFEGVTPSTRLPMTASEFGTFIESAPPQLRTNAVNSAIQRLIQPPSSTAPVIGPTTVTTKAQFDALPSGAEYVGKNGKRYRKP